MRRMQLAVLAGVTALGLAAVAGYAQHRSNGSASAGRAADSVGSSAGGLAPGAISGGAVSAPAAHGASPPVTLLAGAALIRIADLRVELAHAAAVAPAANRAEQIAITAGGRVDADNRTSGAQATAALTLKVPASSLTDLLTRLAALGTEKSRQLSTQDVTAQLVDVTSRVTSARAAIASLEQLYSRATKVSDVIEIETTLAQREADLESMESQQHALQAQTALATVTLELTTAGSAPQPRPASTGFTGGLRRGWDNFARAAAWLAAAVGAVLPFAVLFGILAGVAILVRRWRHREPGAPRDPAPTSP